MSIVEQYGFDALFNQLVEMWPEVRLHVVRKEQKTIVSLQALNESAIVIGRPEEDVGSCVRRTIADLHTRLVVADSRRDEDKDECEDEYEDDETREKVEALNTRANELEESVADLNREIGERLQNYEDLMSDGNFAPALTELARVQELTSKFQTSSEELDKLEAELEVLDPHYDIRDSL